MLVSRVTRSKEQAKATYDGLSRSYDLLAGGFERRHRDAAARKLQPQEGDVVLEVGFGTGHSVLELARAVGRTGKVYGIDISQGMLNIAQSRVDHAGVSDRVALKCGDALYLPFEAAFFDGIFISFTLELFDTPEIPLVLAECKRVLRTRGRICVVALSKKGEPSAMTRLYEWFHERLPDYVDCRPIFVEIALEKAGLHTLEATDLFFLGLRGESVLAEKPPAELPQATPNNSREPFQAASRPTRPAGSAP
jgi:demethylmenaquinone methyltransferase/2-methoxy-6-polyprenyl-1,4-benzoquinol methylase